MDVMPIAKFKGQCLSVLDRVRRTGRPVRVTRYGRPVADIVPVAAPPRAPRTLGTLRNDTTITGDLLAPVTEPGEWETLR